MEMTFQDYITETDLSLLGIGRVPHGDADFTYYEYYHENDKELLYDETRILDIIWYHIFGFCGCGNPDEQMAKIKEVLERCDTRANHPQNDEIYLYLLDAHKFTEHGHSIYGSWLTDKGKVYLKILQHELV